MPCSSRAIVAASAVLISMGPAHASSGMRLQISTWTDRRSAPTPRAALMAEVPAEVKFDMFRLSLALIALSMADVTTDAPAPVEENCRRSRPPEHAD
jgi:hypothetical protein